MGSRRQGSHPRVSCRCPTAAGFGDKHHPAVASTHDRTTLAKLSGHKKPLGTQLSYRALHCVLTHSLPLYSAPSPRLGVLRDHDYSNTLRCENTQERKQTFLTLTIQHSLVCVRNPIPLRATGAWLTRDTHTHNTIHRVIN
jgi:hypothetical protein